MNDLDQARREVTAHSTAGAPFLIAYGLTLTACGLLGFVLAPRTVAFLALFQGGLALPLAFALERWMARGRMAADNPLRPLSVQLAMSQLLGLPAAFIALSWSPVAVPAALAAIAGAHFVPYVWLQRTRLYAVLGGVVSIGTFAMLVWLKKGALPWSLLYMGGLYLLAAPLLVRHAGRLIAAEGGCSSSR